MKTAMVTDGLVAVFMRSVPRGVWSGVWIIVLRKGMDFVEQIN